MFFGLVLTKISTIPGSEHCGKYISIVYCRTSTGMLALHAGFGKRYSSPQGEGMTVSTPTDVLLPTFKNVPATLNGGLHPDGEVAPNTPTLIVSSDFGDNIIGRYTGRE